MPSESPLRAAFRRAELSRVGLDFRAVHAHPRASWLLRQMADAYERGHFWTAEACARRLAGMRRDLSSGS